MGNFRRFAPMFMPMAVVGILLGVFLFSQPVRAADAPVSNVVLTDADTVGPGLDGRDFRITWTPSSTWNPTTNGFSSIQIFITTSGIQLTTSTITSVSICGGSVAPQNRGFFIGTSTFLNMATFTLPNFPNNDSCVASYATSSTYVAWVYISSTVPFLASSTAVSYASAFDVVADTGLPQITHDSYNSANASATATIYAFLFDDQTQGMAFGNLSDGGSEFFRLYYGTDLTVSETGVDAIAIMGAGDLFSFTIPASAVPSAGNTLKYYLVAQDAAGNKRFDCSGGTSTSSCHTGANPYTITTVVPGSRSVSGTVTDSVTAGVVASAKVFPAGFAGGVATTTDASGNYIITGLPTSSAFVFKAAKFGYVALSQQISAGTANLTGKNFSLGQGSFGYMTGGIVSTTGANIVLYRPAKDAQSVNISDSILVGWNQAMDSNSITQSSPSPSTSVYLIKSVNNENVPGAVTYCSASSSPGCSALGLGASDTNVIVFDPTNNLATSTQYTLVITQGVKTAGGSAINEVKKSNFTTMGDQVSGGSIASTIGTDGSSMPPYVKSIAPAPGVTVAPNVPILLTFNEVMQSASINATNLQLWLGASQITSGVTVSLDANTLQNATISHGALSAGEYEVRVLGGAAKSSGMTMRFPTSSVAFSSKFTVSGSNDTTAPTIYPSVTDNSTGVAVNKVFDFGLSEPLAPATVNNSNITMTQGSTAVSANVIYNAGNQSVTVAPSSVLSPNTVYKITFSASVTDLAGNAMVARTITYTTGAADTTAPQLLSVRCNDGRCEMVFNEPMLADASAAGVSNPSNWTITANGSVVSLSGKPFSYDSTRNAVTVTGLTSVAMPLGATVTTTVSASTTDLSDNLISSSARSFVGKVEDSQTTMDFGGTGMFSAPTQSLTGSTIGGGEFKPQGFGGFTAEQFGMGQAAMAFPFNPTASADSNVFQVRFAPGVTLQNGDQVVLTFPNGTNVSSAALDTNSPFYTDFNQFSAGVVTGTALSADGNTLKVTVTLGVSGSPIANDSITLDLKKIVNPSIPKDYNSGGYTVSIQVLRAGVAIATKTSMPYFIMAAGTNALTVYVVAGTNTSTPTSGANGTVYLHGGGPSGPMDRKLTLTNGQISAVDGSTTSSVAYTSLSNGCYYIGAEPSATLGDIDYSGEMSQEPVCFTGNQSKSKYLLFTSTSGGSTATLTVKFVNTASGLPYNFGSTGKDIDIFAGGPGKMVMKTLTSVTTSLSAGYQIKLTANGNWFVGFGPAMPKGTSSGRPVDLGVMPPSPVNLTVSTIEATPALSVNGTVPSGVSFSTSTATVTFTFATADKTIAGTVKDTDGNGLSNFDVFLHRQGFGSSAFTQTNASGTFSLNVSNYGTYEIGVRKDGLPEVNKSVEIRQGIEAPDSIYVDGKDVTNNFIITVKKAAYTISGKVLDSSSNGIGYAPVMAVDANGSSAFGMTASDGSYTLFVDNGTWTLRAQLPPAKTDTCGSLSKTVAVSGSSQSSQNITPSTDTCYTLSGTIANSNNMPVFIQAWDSANSRPVIGGARINASTDSSGAYSVKVAAGTYRVGSFSPTYGEVSTITTVSADSSANITMTIGTVNFAFTNGTAQMTATIEIKNNGDKNKGLITSVTGLAATTSISVPDTTATYSYFARINGSNTVTGTISSFSSGVANVTISLPNTNFITVTGTVYDSSTSTKSGVLVKFSNASTTVTAITNSNGIYSASLSPGTYAVIGNLSGYLGSRTTSVSFTTNTTGYDIGGSSADQTALKTSAYVISGVVSSSAGTAMTDGYVWGTNAAGTVVTAPISATGTYVLPVDVGVWTIKAIGPNHAKTVKSGTVTITTADSSGNNFALTADTAATPTSTSGSITASEGGAINDSGSSGVTITAPKGALETGSGDVTLNIERNFNAPDTASAVPLANASFGISGTGSSGAIKDLPNNVEVKLDYSSLLSSLPSNISEDKLSLVYYSTEKGEYVPVEGGFTVDAANNTITGLTNHFTDFMITYTQGSAGVTVTESDSATAVTEGGTTDTVSYVLTSQPTADVVITPAIASQATRSPSSLTFTSANYATPQSITITATDDSTVEGSHSATITHTVTSADSNYNGLSISNITVTITDNDSVGSGGSSGGGGSADITPPTNTSIVIAAGATSTATTSVSLTLAATDASQMMIGNDSVFTDGIWTTYSTAKAWSLTTGAGVKTVYAKFRDPSGNVSAPVSDTITLTGATTTTPTTSTPAVTPTTTPVAVITTPTPVSVVVTPAVVIIKFKNNLASGAKGDAVKDLQSYLKELGFFTYPTITGVYGPVTMKALKAYQKANGLTPTGKLDAATREKLNGATTTAETPATTGDYKFTSALKMGSTGEEVKQLQQLLKDLGYFTYPSITGYYGAGTRAAVVKFQKAKGLKPYPGWIGPGTRAVLNAM